MPINDLESWYFTAVNYGIESNRIRQDNKNEIEKIKNSLFEENKLKDGADEVRKIASKKLLANQLLGLSFKDFSNQEQRILKDYYYANNLLIDCLLKTDYVIRNQLRSEIFEILFL